LTDAIAEFFRIKDLDADRIVVIVVEATDRTPVYVQKGRAKMQRESTLLKPRIGSETSFGRVADTGDSEEICP
jgi:hypothetical protein